VHNVKLFSNTRSLKGVAEGKKKKPRIPASFQHPKKMEEVVQDEDFKTANL
jgi:hypothetical protein